ncbi:MAG: polymorphic toxin-type HINT domain-containing protein, partial [Planctomycetaceae bacterium]
NAVARERLGHVPNDGNWISPEDYARTAARQADMAESQKRWGPAIAENVRLLSGVRRQRDRGHDALFAIRDTSAIPAMERLLTNGSETHGLLLIEWLSRLNAYEAGQALARVSLGTPTDRVRREAALALRSRPFDEFMPVLLGALQFPVELQSRTYVNADGWVVLDMLFDSETQDEHRQLQLSTEVGKQLVIMPTGSIRLNGRSYLAGYQKGPDLGDKLAAQRYLLVRERQADQQRLQWNERIRQINERAESSLHIVTENHEPAGPANWWDWWISFNEVHATGVKPTLRVQPDPERVYVQNPDKQLTDRQPRAVWEGSLAAGGQGSCLVAGTPVWTERGLTPVEQVQVGDRVLAQELTSGELAYKPVLATTVRPPVGTFNIAADGITVRATGGHPFWVNGEGWRFARDLKPGMCFHGADGSREIKSVEPAEESEAFNLVVADFHTYFIGDGQILSHDNTPRSPTNALVPGLLREP